MGRSCRCIGAAIAVLLTVGTAVGPVVHGNEGPRVPLVSNEEGWRLLPPVEGEARPPLPNWARAFVRSLPRTTAAMLNLDRLHRTQSPLGPVLRGRMRWVAADANHCAYSRACAEADLRRAGADDEGLRALRGDLSGFPERERAALHFARKMTVDASAVTDADVRQLMESYGPEKVTAMVLLLAHANFQDRMLLALGIPIEAGGPLPPLDVVFRAPVEPRPVPARVKPVGRPAPEAPAFVRDAEWSTLNFDDLQERLQGQRSRPGRIRVPSWEEVQAVLPPGYPPPRSPLRIQWSLVCLGYQPELAAAWSACTRAFGEEANQDRVFEESLFWVVTRTIHCFY